jgi:predicted molibdopterin-dependent oxidoreductase YjgC
MTIVSASISTVSARVDGAEIEIPEGSTVLDACRLAGADIPTLCYGSSKTGWRSQPAQIEPDTAVAW